MIKIDTIIKLCTLHIYAHPAHYNYFYYNDNMYCTTIVSQYYIQYISNIKNIILSENRLFIYYEYRFSILYLIFKTVCTYYVIGIRYILLISKYE